jgi:phospholipid transport system substrate-binding protein
MFRTFKRSLGALLLLCVAGMLAAAEQNPEQNPERNPEEVVQRAADQLIQVIEEGKTYYDEDPQRFYREVRDVLDPVVDFEAFSRSVMGPHVRRASPEQRRRFNETFKDGLISTYARALLNFDGEEIRIVPDDRPARDPDRRNVRMELQTSDGRVFQTSYTMVRNGDGNWLVRNILVEGINIGLTYRNQFQSAMRTQADLDAVIDEWGETIAAADPVAAELEGQ